MPYCRIVKLLCTKPIHTYPYYRRVKIGDKLTQHCEVGYCNPNPCTIAPTTSITVAERIEWRVKQLDHNVLIDLRFPTARQNREVYIYPTHLWETIDSRLVEPLGKGEPPKEQGAILHGPPGTGKTSMAQILTWIHGLYRVDVAPENVLSKWVGESEQRLAARLTEAEINEPSLVLLDDAEWLIRSRQVLAGGEESGVYLGLISILLRKVETWKRRGRSVVAIVTTNVGEDHIDPALRRSGRLGRTIFVPLPDYEAVRVLLEELGVDSREAEELAVKIVNAGLPMSDAVSIAHDVLEGRKPRIEPMKGRGYIRPVPPSLGPEEEKFLKRYAPICRALTWGTRMWFAETPTVSIPIATTLVGQLCKKPVVVLNDQRYFDEAITTADTNQAVLIVASDYMAPDIIRTLHTKAKSSIIYCGAQHPHIDVHPLALRYELPHRKAILKILAKYYDIEYTERDLHDVCNLKEDEFKNLAKNLGLFRAPLKTIKSRTAPF